MDGQTTADIEKSANGLTQQLSDLEQVATDFQHHLTQLNVTLLMIGSFSQARAITRILESFNDVQKEFRRVARRSAELGVSNEKSSDETEATEADGGYPRFERRGAVLVKVGRSRSGDEEYEQKCSRKEWKEIIAALEQISDDGQPFKATEVTQAVSEPNYKVYLVLKALQQTGLVDCPRRGEYRLATKFSGDLADGVWQTFGYASS